MNVFSKYRDLPVEHSAIDLLDYESTFQFGITPGITTVTFFQSHDFLNTCKYLEDRFRKILHANPWLAGRLMWIKNKKRLQLVYPNHVSDNHIHSLFDQQGNITVDIDTHYNNIVSHITKNKQVSIPSGLSLRNKNKPLTKITISALAENRFSIIFSLSHIIADGATYYSILNMLLSHDNIMSLNAVRKKTYTMKKAVGKADFSFLSYKTYLLNIIRTSIFGPKVKVSAFYINDSSIKKTKEISKKTGTVGYISTNDIITSGFMNANQFRLCMMAINFREKIDDITMLEAGNYEGVKLYDRDIYNTPEGIRQSLQTTIPYNTRANKLPGSWESLWMRIGLITNWASFTGNFTLQKCQQILHIPIMPTNMVPFDCAVIFRPQPNRTAILIMSKFTDPKEYCENQKNLLYQSLGDAVSEIIFGTD